MRYALKNDMENNSVAQTVTVTVRKFKKFQMATPIFLHWNVISIVKNPKELAHCFFAWDPCLISPRQNEKKKPRNTNFGFYIGHSHDSRCHARWMKRHCRMQATYVAFCHSKDAAFRGKHGEIVKIYYLNLQNATQILHVYCRNHGYAEDGYALSKLYGT